MLSRGIVRFFSRKPTVVSSTLKAYVWLPAKKTYAPRVSNTPRRVIQREVLSPVQAKKRFALNEKGVDPWGHVAVKVSIDASGEAQKDLLKVIQNEAIKRGIKPKAAKKIKKIEVYVSFYPDTERSLPESFTLEEMQVWKDGVFTGDASTDKGKEKSLYLFTQSYKAYNGDYENDIAGYGTPNVYTFSIGLNYSEVIKQCFVILKPSIEGNTLVMREAADNAAYYGRQMLEHHKLIYGLTKKDDDLLEQINETRPEDAMHVCTTVILSLIRAVLGNAQYYKLVDQVSENPEVMHGFPITHFVDAFFRELLKLPTFSPVSNAADTPKQSSKAKATLDRVSADVFDEPRSYKP